MHYQIPKAIQRLNIELKLQTELEHPKHVNKDTEEQTHIITTILITIGVNTSDIHLLRNGSQTKGAQDAPKINILMIFPEMERDCIKQGVANHLIIRATNSVNKILHSRDQCQDIFISSFIGALVALIL
jgi:hypothetical protein